MSFPRPEIAVAGHESHRAGDDDLGRDETIEQHAHAQHVSNLVERWGIAEHKRAKGDEHDEARHADDVARLLEALDYGRLAVMPLIVELGDRLHEEDVVVEAQADDDREGDARRHPEEAAAHWLQTSPAQAIEPAVLVNADRRAERDDEHPDEAEHST